MILLSRILVFLASIMIFLGFRIGFYLPRYYLIFSIGMVIVLTFSTLFILHKKTSKIDKILFLISPLFFLMASILAGTFFDSNYFKTLFSIIAAIFISLYLESLFAYFYLPSKYQICSLENISAYINLITVFFISFSFYGLKMLFGINSYNFLGLVIFNFLFLSILIYQTFWINNILISKAKNSIFALALILSEVYLIIFLLPSSFYVNGLFFSIIYYSITGLITYNLLSKLDKKSIYRHILIASVVFIFLLITTQWF